MKNRPKTSPSEWTFTVEGPLMGYRASPSRAFDPRFKRWKQMVRLLANLAGVPDEPTEETVIAVDIMWKGKARIDGKNVLAVLEDSLFKNDRKVAEGHWRRYLNAGREFAIVKITEGGEHEDSAL